MKKSFHVVNPSNFSLQFSLHLFHSLGCGMMASTNTPDLEDEIISYIDGSSIEAIQAAGKSYINCWCPIHFTKGKYSDHLTIQESTLQCINAFLNFKYANNAQTQLFYRFVKASPRQRTKELMQSIVKSVDKKVVLKSNVHFEKAVENQAANDVVDGDEKEENNEIEWDQGSLGYEMNQLVTLQMIQAKSASVHEALVALMKSYFSDLSQNHGVKLSFEDAQCWAK